MRDYRTELAAAMPKTGAQQAGPQWSVVIPAYNEEQYLGETLASIMSQTIRDAVVILVDNGSSDDTNSIMKAFVEDNPDRNIVILSDLRPGKINALETGIAAVESEYVALCDADTIYPPQYLERTQMISPPRVFSRRSAGPGAMIVVSQSRAAEASSFWRT